MAEGNGLLNRRRGKTSTEGSNPSLSATVVNRDLVQVMNASKIHKNTEVPLNTWFLVCSILSMLMA